MGNATTGGSGEAAFDLFDRWLAHREGGDVESLRDPEPEPTPEPEPEPPSGFENPLFAVTARDTSAGLHPLAPLAPDPLAAPVQAEIAPPAPAAPVSDESPPAGSRPEHDAARTVLAAFAESRPSPVTPPQTGAEVGLAERGAADVPRTPGQGKVIAAPLPAVALPGPDGPDTPAAPARVEAASFPAVIEFAPRRGVRRVTGLLLLAALAGTAATGYAAWQDRTTTSIGIAATLAVLTGVIWAVRSGSSVAILTVRGGNLTVERAGGRHQFDLASHYTPIDVVGEPGSRGWKVLFHRRSMAPFVIDASMVDPVEFTRVVRHYRPAD